MVSDILLSLGYCFIMGCMVHNLLFSYLGVLKKYVILDMWIIKQHMHGAWCML